MSTFIQLKGGTLVPVPCESSSRRAPSVQSSEFVGITGAVTRFRAPRVRHRIELGFGAKSPEQIGMLTALHGGAFGPAPVRVVDAWAQTTNLLDQRTSLLEPWSADARFSSAVRVADDGHVMGAAMVNVTSGLTLTPGVDRHAPAPRALTKVTVSAYVSGPITDTVTIRPVWSARNGLTLNGPMSGHFTLPADNVLTRVWMTYPVPKQITTSSGASDTVGVGVAVNGATVAGDPAVTWSDELLPWMDGQCPRKMVVVSPQYDTYIAWGTPGGQRAGASVTFEEVG